MKPGPRKNELEAASWAASRPEDSNGRYALWTSRCPVCWDTGFEKDDDGDRTYCMLCPECSKEEQTP